MFCDSADKIVTVTWTVTDSLPLKQPNQVSNPPGPVSLLMPYVSASRFTSADRAAMLKFLTRKPKEMIVARPPRMIKWTQFKRREGTTALIPYERQARPGWKITHTSHGKVRLLGKFGDTELKVEKLDSVEQIIVDAADCGEPINAPVKVTSTEQETVEEWYRDVWVPCAIKSAIARATSMESSNAAGKRPMPIPDTAPTETPSPTTTKRPVGRPKGAKDKTPGRVRSKPSLKITWTYGGKHGVPGLQYATLGNPVHHDSIPNSMPAVVIQQPSLSSLVLQLGDGDDASIMTVDSRDVQAAADFGLAHSAPGEARSSGTGQTGGTKQKRKRVQTGGTKQKRKRVQTGQSRAAQLQPAPLTKAVKKQVAVQVRKRKRREATAAARGKPLKAARGQKNRAWEDAYKQQAAALFNRKFSSGAKPDYGACKKELEKLPGFDGVTRSNIRSWVCAEAKRAIQKPNELGLIVTAKGRPPALPQAMYDELCLHIKELSKTRAFTMNAITMRPIVLAFITLKLGPSAIWLRPGHGGFLAGPHWLQEMARAAKLSWRKPYGDARKAPPNAKELIHDCVLRLAYLMHEFDIPPCLVLNFDHTGLHFMQMRGNTWTFVEEDTETEHHSRQHKNKEVKQQNVGDKRQATGTPGTSMAGDTLPGQLVFESSAKIPEAGTGSLPVISGTKYIQSTGSNLGHTIGYRMVEAPSAILTLETRSNAKLLSQWLGHLVQTSNHWANIKTSYAILEFIIVPWLLEKKRAIGKPADAKCVLLIDCWYGWKDQDKKKTLISFRHYVRNHYPWLRLLFVPAACTDLAQPADRGMISWIKAYMRSYYTDIISKDVLEQLDSVPLSNINVDTSAPYLKRMLANSFARALSELPRNKVIACWAPLQDAWDKKEELHAEAQGQLQRLFPNNVVDVGPAESTPDPDPIITAATGDDFEVRDAQLESAASAEVHARFSSMASARAAVAQATAVVASYRLL